MSHNFLLSYAPVLDLMRFNTSLTIAKETATPNITNANVPNVVKAPAPVLAVASQNKDVKPSKNSLANSPIKPKPLVIAEIIALPIIISFFLCT